MLLKLFISPDSQGHIAPEGVGHTSMTIDTCTYMKEFLTHLYAVGMVVYDRTEWSSHAMCSTQ